MSDVVITLPRPHAAQKEVLANHSRFVVLRNGRRWGKSVLLLNLLSQTALDSYPAGVFSPNYKYTKSMFDEAKRLLAPVIKSCDGSQHSLTLITGGQIDFHTCDDPNVGRSKRYKRVVIDEAAFITNLDDIFNKNIRATLVDWAGDCWIASTPNGQGDFKTMCEKGDPTHKTYDPEWSHHHYPSSSNPHLPASEIDAAKASLPHVVFLQEYLAEFVDTAGALLKSEFIKYGQCQTPAITVLGVDLAISSKTSADFSSICVLQRDAKGMLYIPEVIRFKKPFHLILEEIQRMATKWSPQVVAVESVQFQQAVTQELLRKTTLNVRSVNPTKDKVTRFMPLLARFEQGQVFLSKSLDPAFEKELLSFPMDAHDDMVDAFSTAFVGLDFANPVPIALQIPSL